MQKWKVKAALGININYLTQALEACHGHSHDEAHHPVIANAIRG